MMRALLILLLLVTGACATGLDAPAFDLDAQVRAYRAAGHLMPALYLVQADAAQQGWTAAHHRQVGDIWQALGDSQQALAHWRTAIQHDQDPVLMRRLIDADLRRGHWLEARLLLDALLVQVPDDTWARFRLGLLLAPSDPLQAADLLTPVADELAYAEAVTPLLAILRDDPGDPLIGLRLGAALAAAGRWAYAERAFQHAADVNYPLPVAMAYVGLAREHQSRDGRQWIDAALSLAPEDALVRHAQALLLRRHGERVASLQAMQYAQSLDPHNPVLMVELAVAYQLIDEADQAQSWLRAAADASDDPAAFAALRAAVKAEIALLAVD